MATGMRLEADQPEASRNIPYLCCPDHRSPAYPVHCFCFVPAGSGALTIISCPHLAEMEEGQELKRQVEGHQKRQRGTRKALVAGGLSLEAGKAAGSVGFLPLSHSPFL